MDRIEKSKSRQTSKKSKSKSRSKSRQTPKKSKSKSRSKSKDMLKHKEEMCVCYQI